MNHSMVALIFQIYKWACVLLGAYALVLGGIALFGLIFNTIKFLFKKSKFFQYFYLVKFLMAGAVAYGYYFFYSYKGLTISAFLANLPLYTVILIVTLALPIGLLMSIDHFLLNEPVRNG